MSAILDYREHIMVTMVYKMGMTQAEIAVAWGMSQQRVSQVVEGALVKMRLAGGFCADDVEFLEID